MSDFDLSAFVASITVDLSSTPPSPNDSDHVRRLKQDPPQNSDEFNDFLNSLPGGDTQIDVDISDEEHKAIIAESENDSDIGSDDETDEDEQQSEDEEDVQPTKKTGGRRGGDDLKNDAFKKPFMGTLASLLAPCNNTCTLGKACTKQVPMDLCFEARQNFFGPLGKPGPGDRDRAAKIMDILKNDSRRDHNDNISFKLNKYRLCTAGYLRIIGLSDSPDLGKAPGQFRRLLTGFLRGADDLELLATEKIKLDAKDRYSAARGMQIAFINMLGTYFSDSIPVAKYQKGNAMVDIRQLPYKHLTDVYNELKYHCETAEPPVSKSIYGSYSLFKKVFDGLHKAKIIQLLGGKQGFQTCYICNHCLAKKKAAAANRDRSTIEVCREIHRLHLKQEQTERQHCENYILLAKTMYNTDGQPERWFIELDGMSRYKTLVPKFQKDRKDAMSDDLRVENRLIGARIVCGPIDMYIGITTGELIPGGANPMIEATRMSLETLARKLAELPLPVALPKMGGFNGDNCGDNKVRVSKYLI